MANHNILFLALFITFFYAVNSRKKVLPAPRIGPVPPQPSQYTASVLTNGMPGMYYADTTIHRDRLSDFNQTYSLIVDFQKFRQYTIIEGSCSWSQIPGKITPLLVFPTYDYNGTVTYNKTLCNKWSGCHGYEIPPAPFNYYATVKENIPIDLNLTTIGINIHFSNFTFGPPPSNVFDIPTNCTEGEFNSHSHLHPIFSHMMIENRGVGMLC